MGKLISAFHACLLICGLSSLALTDSFANLQVEPQYRSVSDFFASRADMTRIFAYSSKADVGIDSPAFSGTLFVPTDRAWESLLVLMNVSLTADVLKAILQYHTYLDGVLPIESMPMGMSRLNMADGQEVLISRGMLYMAIFDTRHRMAKVDGLPIFAGNSIIYVLNAVLLPNLPVEASAGTGDIPGGHAAVARLTTSAPIIWEVPTPKECQRPTFVDILRERGFNTFLTILYVLNSESEWICESDLTILAPRDPVLAYWFAVLASQGFNTDLTAGTIDPTFRTIMDSMVKLHLLTRQYFVEDLTDGLIVNTEMPMSTLTIDLQSNPRTVTFVLTQAPSSSIYMTLGNVQASNNVVIHEVNAVFNPLAS